MLILNVIKRNVTLGGIDIKPFDPFRNGIAMSQETRQAKGECKIPDGNTIHSSTENTLPSSECRIRKSFPDDCVYHYYEFMRD